MDEDDFEGSEDENGDEESLFPTKNEGFTIDLKIGSEKKSGGDVFSLNDLDVDFLDDGLIDKIGEEYH